MMRDLRASPIDRLTGADPVREFPYEGLTAPAGRAVRSRREIEIVAHLHDTLTDPAPHRSRRVRDVRTDDLEPERAPFPQDDTMTDHQALDAEPAVRFSDAEKINPFDVLIELQDHVLRYSSGLSRPRR